MEWTDARIARLKELRETGKSAAQIANILGGVTRNAVIGKTHRLGLTTTGPKRPNMSRQQRRIGFLRSVSSKGAAGPAKIAAAIKRTFLQLPPPPVVAPSAPSAPELVRVANIVDLEAHHCRWIPGEPTDGYCGADKVMGLPYCEAHAQRAYRVGTTPVHVGRNPDYGPAKAPARLNSRGLALVT